MLTFLVQFGHTIVAVLQGVFIVSHPSCCVALIFIFVVELQFLLHVESKLQHFVVKGVSFYMCML
jgi:hypothetical protein